MERVYENEVWNLELAARAWIASIDCTYYFSYMLVMARTSLSSRSRSTLEGMSTPSTE